jgi:hypothetical protein
MVRVVIMLTGAICVLFLLVSVAVLMGALGANRQLSDGEAGLLLVLGTGMIGLVSAGLGAYFGIEEPLAPENQPFAVHKEAHHASSDG